MRGISFALCLVACVGDDAEPVDCAAIEEEARRTTMCHPPAPLSDAAAVCNDLCSLRSRTDGEATACNGVEMWHPACPPSCEAFIQAFGWRYRPDGSRTEPECISELWDDHHS